MQWNCAGYDSNPTILRNSAQIVPLSCPEEIKKLVVILPSFHTQTKYFWTDPCEFVSDDKKYFHLQMTEVYFRCTKPHRK